MTYLEAVAFLKMTYDKEIRLGLDRIKLLLSWLNNPQDKLKFIHVAGTNGKGSVCAMTAEILKQAGYKTGLFTSPVISEYREQFVINGEMIDEDTFMRLADEVKTASDMMEDKPSEFEKVVALAFLYFAENDCDFVVLEVGMGGDLDATNIIDTPEVAAIVNIDYDHMSFLGDTLLQIADKKSGIIKEDGCVVIAEQDDYVMQLLVEKCQAKNARFVRTSTKSIEIYEKSIDGQVFDYKNYKGIELALLGNHQCENAAIVIEIIECLIEKGYDISEDAVYDGMKSVSWPGRFELVSKEPVIIIDGAHNPHGIDALCDNLKSYLPDKEIVFIVGILKDKDYTNMLKKVIPYAKSFVTITPNNPRALSARDCAKAIENAGFEGEIIIQGVFEQAVESAKKLAGNENPICCFGSLYSVGMLRKIVL